MNSSPEAPFVCGVVAPTYNNARTLADVLNRLSTLDVPIIVVNDGSTDDTEQIIAEWMREVDPMRTIVEHPHNLGKGAALRSGFVRAQQLGWTHAITIDTDGQHDPDDVPAMAEAAWQFPQHIICGVRDESAAGMPPRSAFGRRWSNRLVAMNAGVRTNDSQCGFRVYPIDFICNVRVPEQRFDYEAACLVRCGWIGVDCHDVPVGCTYAVDGGRVSHHRAVRDTLRALAMHARFFALSLRPWPVRRDHRLPVAAIPDDATTLPRTPGTLFTRFLRWLDPRPAWRSVKRDPKGRRRFAAAIALGTFIANLPAYGGQIALSLLAARWFRLPPLPVVTGAHLSTPPLGPILVALAIGVGSRLIHGKWPTHADFDPREQGWWSLIQNVLLEWLVGSVILGVACALTTFLVGSLVLRLMIRREVPNPH